MTSLNSPFPVPEGRRPFFRVLANKAPIINVAEVEVRLNQHFTSDRYTVTLPLWGQPLPMNYAWWATQTDIEIEILAGFVNARGVAGYQSLIVGTIDDIEEDWGNGKLLLNGRDYSGMFIESVTDGENFFDMTPAAAAAAIAANHTGITTNITQTLADLKTPQVKIGRLYGDQNTQGGATRMTWRQSEWDFLSQIAQEMGFVVLMQGRTLYFGPPPQLDNNTPFVITVRPPVNGQKLQSNAENLKFRRSLTLARDVDVYVLSTSRWTGTSVRGHAKAVNKIRADRSGQKIPAQKYVYTIPDLTQLQADQKALSIAQALTRRERIVTGTLPGDPRVSAMTVFKVSGSGTEFDQTYYVDQAVHRISADTGYCMDLTLKNSSPYSIPAVQQGAAP